MLNQLTTLIFVVAAFTAMLTMPSSPAGAQASAELLPVGSYTYGCDEGQSLQLVAFDAGEITIQCGEPGAVIAVPDEAAAQLNSACAARVQPRAEYMPHNTTYNQRRIAASERGRAMESLGEQLNREFDATVRGDYTGTTDEILQYYACLYRLDLDLVRAVAWTESTHDARTNGDGGESWGLMQVRNSRKSHWRALPAAQRSTAYNVEYWAWWQRVCQDGRISWLGERTRNNVMGCVGTHFYGASFMDDRSADYRARVLRNYREQPWKAAWK
jgi:hypothetical protein